MGLMKKKRQIDLTKEFIGLANEIMMAIRNKLFRSVRMPSIKGWRTLPRPSPPKIMAFTTSLAAVWLMTLTNPVWPKASTSRTVRR